MQQRSNDRLIAAQKIMTQKHLLTSIIDETLHTLQDLAEKGSRGFDCSAHSLSVLNSWKRTTDGRRRMTDHGYQPPADFQLTPDKAPEPTLLDGHIPSESAGLSAPISEDSLESIVTDMGDCQRCKLSASNPHCFWRRQPFCKTHVCGRGPRV